MTRHLHRFCLLPFAFVLLPVFAFETLLQAQGEFRKDLPIKPLQFAAPDWNVYHRTNRLLRAVVKFTQNCPNANVIAKLSVPGDGLSLGAAPSEHRDISLETLSGDSQLEQGLTSASEGLLYVSITARRDGSRASRARKFAKDLLSRGHDKHVTRAMFVFGEEGRDLLTSEIALSVLGAACGTDSSNATVESLEQEKLLRQVQQGMELVLVPIVNPDGRRIAEMGRRCDRTNGNDVDVDKNWPAFWGDTTASESENLKRATSRDERNAGLRAAVSRRFISRVRAAASGISYDPSSGGTHPFSEPETRALKAIVEKVKPTSYVSVRTGDVAVTIPWDCKPDLLEAEQRGRLTRVADSLTASHCSRCKVGNLWNVTGHTKCGTGTDYMYGTLQIPFVHAWQVYNVAAHRGDCFRRHNPTTKAAFDRVTRNWASAVFNFTTAVHNWMTLEASDGLLVAEHNASLSAAEASAQRAEALARGDPDPENDETERDEKGHKLDTASTLTALEAQQGEIVTQNGSLLSWVLSKQKKIKSLRAENKERTFAVGPRPMKKGAIDGSETKLAVLTGWWGVWTASLVLALGLFIAKRYVFIVPSKRSRFRCRAPVKNA